MLVEDISPKDHMKTLTYEELKIVLGKFQKSVDEVTFNFFSFSSQTRC